MSARRDNQVEAHVVGQRAATAGSGFAAKRRQFRRRSGPPAPRAPPRAAAPNPRARRSVRAPPQPRPRWRARLSAESNSACTRAAAMAPSRCTAASAVAGQGEAALIGLPAEIGVGNRAGEQQRRGAAIGARGVRLVDRGVDGGALFAPPIEGVARLQSEIEEVVPMEAQQLRREQPLSLSRWRVSASALASTCAPAGGPREPHRFARRVEARMRRRQRSGRKRAPGR